MTILEQSKALEVTLKKAQEQAIALQKDMKTANLDVVNIGAALHVVGLRINYLSKAKTNAKAEPKAKSESKESNKPETGGAGDQQQQPKETPQQ